MMSKAILYYVEILVHFCFIITNCILILDKTLNNNLNIFFSSITVFNLLIYVFNLYNEVDTFKIRLKYLYKCMSIYSTIISFIIFHDEIYLCITHFFILNMFIFISCKKSLYINYKELSTQTEYV